MYISIPLRFWKKTTTCFCSIISQMLNVSVCYIYTYIHLPSNIYRPYVGKYAICTLSIWDRSLGTWEKSDPSTNQPTNRETNHAETILSASGLWCWSDFAARKVAIGLGSPVFNRNRLVVCCDCCDCCEFVGWLFLFFSFFQLGWVGKTDSQNPTNRMFFWGAVGFSLVLLVWCWTLFGWERGSNGKKAICCAISL